MFDAGGCAMSGENGIEAKTLRRLRAPEPVAAGGGFNPWRRTRLVLRPLDRIDDRQGRNGAWRPGEPFNHAVDDAGIEKGTCSVMDQDRIGFQGGQALEPIAHRLLSRRTA